MNINNKINIRAHIVEQFDNAGKKLPTILFGHYVKLNVDAHDYTRYFNPPNNPNPPTAKEYFTYTVKKVKGIKYPDLIVKARTRGEALQFLQTVCKAKRSDFGKIKVTPTVEEVCQLLDKFYLLSEINRNSTIQGSIVHEAVENWELEPVDTWLNECFDTYEGAEYELKTFKKEVKRKVFDGSKKRCKKWFAESEDEIRQAIQERNESTPFTDICRQTDKPNVRVTLFSNGDCLNSNHWESLDGYCYTNDYLGDLLDTLNINPQAFKKAAVARNFNLRGAWPNKKNRDEKNLVTISALLDELDNNTCASNWVFLNQVEIQEIGSDLSAVVVPKGTLCGLFSHFEGGGSLLDCVTLYDITLDLTKKSYPHFSMRSDFGKYSVKEVYGTDNRIFESPLQFIKKS